MTRPVVTLVAAGGLVVATVAAVLVWGVHRPPPLPTVAEQPRPAPVARVAWMATVDDARCLHVARRGGAVTVPWCARAGGGVAGWTDRGEVVVTGGPGTPLAIDPATGDERSASLAWTPGGGGADEGPPDTGVTVRGERDGDELVVRADGEPVWRTEAPPTYVVTTGTRSPGGEQLALVDDAGRLLLLPADGAGPARVWARDVPRHARPVWEDR